MSSKGKSIELAQGFREKIRSGEWAAGTKFEPIQKLAADCGTSVATISKVFEILENEGLIERLNGLGVYVREQVKYRFAVIFDSRAELGAFAHKAIFMKYFIEKCRSGNMSYTVFENVDTPSDCLRVQKQMKTNIFDIAVIASRCFAEHCKKYLKDIPVFPIGLYPYKWLKCTTSFTNDWIQDAAHRLRQYGCSRIALLNHTGDTASWEAPEVMTFEGRYRELTAEAPGIFQETLYKESDTSPRGGYNMARELLRENADCDKLGIISVDSIFTNGIISAIFQSRNSLWKDVFLVSHANKGSLLSDFPVPILTYEADIEQQCGRIFQLAAQYFTTGKRPAGISMLPVAYHDPIQQKQL
ncbi:MAG: GntR family transcriptional regulator [Lentisphaeria bacterium]|nr:GntR family transcriptional regulator [Lentisphaeria bacterium]